MHHHFILSLFLRKSIVFPLQLYLLSDKVSLSNIYKGDFLMNEQNQGQNEEVTVTLTLDNDEVIECAILTIYEVDDKEYIALLPLNDDGTEDEEAEVYLYRYVETEDGEPTLENIEDDDEYDAAADAFDEWLDEQLYDEMVEE